MKRFTATEKWAKPWFRKLEPKHKLLWQWLCDNCDAAGVLEADWDVASLQIGGAVSAADLAAFDGRVVEIGSDKLWLKTFIEFQYGKLSRDCKPHNPVFASLQKHGIRVDESAESERVSKGYPKGMDTLQDTDKDKDTGKEGGAGGIPPVTLEVALANCGQCQATPDMARQWWNDRDTVGWLIRGQPIVRWQSDLASYAGKWRNNEAKYKSNGNNSRPNRQTVTRNLHPPNPNQPSLNATAVNAGQSDRVANDEGPGPVYDGENGW